MKSCNMPNRQWKQVGSFFLQTIINIGQFTHLLNSTSHAPSVFKDHFDCVSKFGPRISSCILIRTQLFRKAITEEGIAPSRRLHDITCKWVIILSLFEKPHVYCVLLNNYSLNILTSSFITVSVPLITYDLYANYPYISKGIFHFWKTLRLW